MVSWLLILLNSLLSVENSTSNVLMHLQMNEWFIDPAELTLHTAHLI